MKLRVTMTAVLLCVACGSPREQPRPTAPQLPEPSPQLLRSAAQAYHTVRDGFLEWYYEAYPVRATRLGIHAHDHRLPSMDPASIQRRIDALLDWDAQLTRIPHRLMRDEDLFDYAVLEFAIRAELLEAEEVRSWARDPRVYTAILASGISAVAERRYAPLDERIGHLRSRLDAGPALLEAARSNLRSPPRVWTELAIDQARGLGVYLDEHLPAILREEAGDGAVVDRIEPARTRLAEAVGEHVQWLEDTLLPAATGDFRLGQYLFLRKLLYEEHVNLTLQELERLNAHAIEDYRARVDTVAAEIDPSRTPRAIMDSIVRLHPAPDELVPTARRMMHEARDWALGADVVTIPTVRVPVVRESPPYARGGFASMDAPGPFESAELDAYYNITNVDPRWTEAQQREHLTYFNFAGLLGVTMHETFPGHYVQLLHERRAPGDVRKVFTPRTLTEGWAHYTEEMALDEGFTDGDPIVRLGQLRRALQRHARWDAALQIHTTDNPLDEIVQRYMEIAFFDEFPARREVVRATYDPTYLYYALGRMQIKTLRSDYEEYLREREEVFSLKDFHDRLLGLALPLPLAKDALMPAEPRQTTRRRR